MSKVLEQLNELSMKVPERFTREKAGATIGLLSLIDRATNPVNQVSELLKSPEMDQLIADRYITIAMIKPRLDEYMKTDEVDINFAGDADLATFLTEQIHDPLKPILSVSLQMDKNMLSEFYGRVDNTDGTSPMVRMMNNKRWDSFSEVFLSGPVTFILLSSLHGNAIDNWRNQMGTNWNISKNDPKTLRTKFAISNENNLLHGSDSLASVIAERDFLVRHMK